MRACAVTSDADPYRSFGSGSSTSQQSAGAAIALSFGAPGLLARWRALQAKLADARSTAPLDSLAALAPLVNDDTLGRIGRHRVWPALDELVTSVLAVTDTALPTIYLCRPLPVRARARARTPSCA